MTFQRKRMSDKQTERNVCRDSGGRPGCLLLELGVGAIVLFAQLVNLALPTHVQLS